jgi:3-oxoacyl-[acyl-carrier protein] reductase
MTEDPQDGRSLVLVTGVGRRLGIGAAVAIRLAAEGWDVATTCLRSYDARMPWGADDEGRLAVLNEVRSVGAWGAEFPADLEVVDEIPALFDAIESASGRTPTALVMCHAESVDSDLLDTRIESFDRHYAVNVRASWLLIREFALRFPSSGGAGRIIAMTSDHTVGNLPYGSTKGALDRLVTAASQELAGRRITANLINPGPTDTGWMSQALKGEVEAATPLRRLGQPKDAANLVAFLCSTDGEWINGQLLSSDGGLAR